MSTISVDIDMDMIEIEDLIQELENRSYEIRKDHALRTSFKNIVDSILDPLQDEIEKHFEVKTLEDESRLELLKQAYTKMSLRELENKLSI